MLKILKEKGIMLLVFLFFYFIFSTLTFNTIGLPLFPKYMVLDYLILIFFTAFIFLIKSNKIALSIYSFFMVFILVLYVTNVTLDKVFGDVFSLQYLSILDEAGEVFEWGYLDFNVVFTAFFIFGLYLFVNIFLLRFFKDKYESDRCYSLNGMFIIVPLIIVLSFIFDYNIGQAKKTAIVNNKLVNEEIYVKYLTKRAISHYGMLTLYYKEISFINDDIEDDGEVVICDDQAYEKSALNGLLKGKNVITIMAESLQNFAITETLTPNLWDLKTKGLSFDNNYSVNKTNVSELLGIAGSYYNLTNKEVDMPFTVPNILNEEYKTSYFHDNSPDFYSRGSINKMVGFENAYYHNDIYPSGFTNELYPDGLNFYKGSWRWSGDYTIDSLTMSMILPKLVSTEEKFYSFWTSLSCHGPYDRNGLDNYDLYDKLGYFDKINEAKEKREWINPLEGHIIYEEYLDCYQAAVMNFDDAIGLLMDYLEEKDLLNDTLIVLYGDHEVYYHDIYLKIAGTSNTACVDKLYETTMIMYNPTLNNYYQEKYGTKNIEKFSSPLIIAPTILDLLGADYSSYDYLNYSFFSDKYLPVFYSYQQRAYMNNALYTEDCESIKYMVKGLTDEEINTFYKNCESLFSRIEYVESLYTKGNDD